MRKTRILHILFAVFLAGIFTSCEDDFTEKDALDKQQTIDLSVYVIDNFSTAGVSEATVSIIKDGNLVTAQTNDLGVATFSNVKIGGGLPVTIEKEGFASTKSLVNVNAANYRVGQITTTMEIFSLTENTATVRGMLEIETDLTNEDPETVPEGTEITAIYNSGSNFRVEISTTIDAEGNYELNLPANRSGISYELTYPTLTLDQVIAKNRNEGEDAFPATFPSIETIETVFRPRGSAINVPSNVPSIYVIVPEPEIEGGIRGRYNSISVNEDGVITGFSYSTRGSGYEANSDIELEIVSLFGGSGANTTQSTDASGNFTFLSSVNVINGGSGYPDFNVANRTGRINPSLSNSVNVQSGEIIILDGSYGTGTSRAADIL